MPIYDFKCSFCGHSFIHISKISKRNNPLNDLCPECGKKDSIFRIYSSASVIGIDTIKADKRMESSGVQSALERIRDNHKDANMLWKG